MKISKIYFIKIFVIVMIICISVLSFFAILNRRYTFNLGWAKVEERHMLIDSNGENEVIVEMEIEHSHKYTYHIHLRIYSKPDIYKEIYRITRLDLNATKNDQYSFKINQAYETPLDSYYNMFLVDNIQKNDAYHIKGSLDVEKTTLIENTSKQIYISSSYTFPYSFEDLLSLNYILLWLDVFILIGIGGLVILLGFEVKSMMKRVRTSEEEYEQQNRYIDYFKKSYNKTEE